MRAFSFVCGGRMDTFEQGRLQEVLASLSGFRQLQVLVGEAGAQAWLVGGCLRDFCLGLPLVDIDVALTTGCGQIAEKLADTAGGSWFWLNRSRGQARVQIPVRKGSGPVCYDLVPLQGCNLMTDLADRDFTINAMALPLQGDQGLFDPFGGLRDLKARRLKTTSPEVVSRDPVRILRGLRFSHLLGLEIDSLTWELLKRAAPALAEVPGERLNLEWGKILTRPVTAELVEAVSCLRLRSILTDDNESSLTGLPPGLVRLERLLEQSPCLTELAQLPVGSGFSAVALVRLGLLLGTNSNETGRHLAERLRLSTACRKVLLALAAAASGPEPAPGSRSLALWLHRLPGGLPASLLIRLVRLDRTVTPAVLDKLCSTSRQLLRDGPPALLLPAEKVAALTGIGPGPRLGLLLNRLVEAEITGEVRSVEDAEIWLKNHAGNAIDKGETDA
ncbi:MAG: CCA tRNA nucleotidyltransferase [Geothermobacteraceae bacterium]